MIQTPLPPWPDCDRVWPRANDNADVEDPMLHLAAMKEAYFESRLCRSPIVDTQRRPSFWQRIWRLIHG